MNVFKSILFFFLLLPIPAAAQRDCTLSGTISAGQHPLAGAVVVPNRTRAGVKSNADGHYTLRLPPGNHALTVSYIGYTTLDTTIVLQRDAVVHFRLREADVNLKEVIVSAERSNANVIRPDMGMEKLDPRQIRQIPALMGEVDIIKAIQLLPGVQAISEGTSGFSVRGGSPDQNLILFENATMYNASHLMGFFSVFNNDAIDDIALYKGDIPAQYGGRLSSLLEVTSRSGRPEFSASAGVGLIASRLLLQGPVVDKRYTFLLAGRRTYADIFLPLAGEEYLRRVDIHFYDLNAKVQARLDEKNELSATGYYGRDLFKNGDMGMNFSNAAYTLRWKRLFSPALFAHLELIGSHYDYNMEATTPSLTGVWHSDINDHTLRADFTCWLNDSHSFRFGYNTTYHYFAPGDGAGLLPDGNEYPIHLAKKQAWENSLYFANRHSIGPLTAKYGCRFTRFDNIGPTTDYRLDEQHRVARGDTLHIAAGRFYNHYVGIEPRVGLVWAFNDAWSLKSSYAHTLQFLHLLTMSTAGSPLDIWVPSNLGIKPEMARQAAAGVFANFFDNALETSVEIYYKWLDNVIDFKDHPEVLMHDVVETEIRTGSGQNYGIELMGRKNNGAFTGWLSYTWSRAFRTIPEINGGQPYSSPFDRPHNINVVLSCECSKRLTASLNWIYATGQPVTFPEAYFQFGNDRIPVYTQRNTYRFPDYHRMDVSLTIRLGRLAPNRKWKHELAVSVYNIYGRKNPWTISFRTEDDGVSQYARMTYLFGVVPSVTYNIAFN